MERKNIKDFYSDFLDDKCSQKDGGLDLERQGVKLLKVLFKSLIDNKKILLYGDYDVDGFFSTIEMETYLKVLESRVKNRALDQSLISTAYSSRADGYELPEDKFRELQKKYDVILFMDTGGSYSYLDENTKNTYVIDHHPSAREAKQFDYIINPNVSGNISTSTGRIVFKMIEDFEQEMKDFFGEKQVKKHDGIKYAQILSGVTLISDMAEKNDENELFLKQTLDLMSDNKKVFSWLNTIRGYDIVDRDLSFNLINVINSWSRMSKPLEEIEDLFKVRVGRSGIYRKTSSDRAKEIYSNLQEAHSERKSITALLEKEVSKQIEGSTESVFAVNIDNKYSGINGLLAQYAHGASGKPSIVMSWDENRNMYVGSGRGEGVRMALEIASSKVSGVHFGGHLMAAGATVKKESIDDFLSVVSSVELPLLRANNKERYYFTESVADFKKATADYVGLSPMVSAEIKYYAMLSGYKNNGIVEKNNGWLYSTLSDKSGIINVYFKKDDKRIIEENSPILLEIINNNSNTHFIQHKSIEDKMKLEIISVQENKQQTDKGMKI